MEKINQLLFNFLVKHRTAAPKLFLMLVNLRHPTKKKTLAVVKWFIQNKKI